MNARDKGKLPSMPEVNPKEQCKAIILRSGQQIGEEEKEKVQNEEFVMIKKDGEVDEEDYEIGQEELKKDSEQLKEPEPITSVSYVPPVPFPHRLKKFRDDKQLQKFV